jgi:tubby-related protein 1
MRYSVQDMNAKLNERFKSGAFVLTAHESGGYTDLVQCLIVREKSTLAMETCYSMYLEDSNKLLIYARKKNLSRTSNYHLYDMTRGLPSKHLSKKSGNYLGKLRALNLTSTEYAVVTQASEREEVAAVVYDQVGIVDQLKDGSQPRRMNVMLPMLDADSIPIPNAVGEAEDGSMVQMLKSAQQGKMFVFRTKEPKFENGNYRLNFHGRVSVPSVKNYQLVSDEEPEHVVCQFGKIGDDRFHLDYKAPLNAFQAFAIALTQFNL